MKSANASFPSRARLFTFMLLGVACLLVAGAPLYLLSGQPARSANSQTASALHGAAAIEQLKQDGSYASLAAAVNATRYHARPGAAGQGWEAPNPAQQFNTTFNAAGLRMAEGAGRIEEKQSARPQWQFGLKLIAYGYGDALTPVSAGTISAQGERIELRRSNSSNSKAEMTEWYVNTPAGLEQGFTLNAAPDGTGSSSDRLRIALRVTGDLRAELAGNGQAVLLKDRRGWVVLSYDHLAAWDATGKPLAAAMKLKGDEIALEVDDAGARYPLTIDPLISQQQKLTAADGAAGDTFGEAVAISGNTALVGATGDNGGQGSAYVFVRSGSAWSQQAKLTASDGAAGDFFGKSVALSGETAMVGASGADFEGNVSHGAAYVFIRSGAVWSQQAKLAVSDGAQVTGFGYAVALSGETAVIGTPSYGLGNDTTRGAAYVYTRNGVAWNLQQKLLASDGAQNDQFGISVSLSGDTTLIGAWNDDIGLNNNQGAAYVFTRSGATWNQQQKLTAADGAFDDRFGLSVSLSGETAVVGAYRHNIGGSPDQGAAYVFVRGGAIWNQQAKLTAADGDVGDNFGNSVAINGDLAVIGADSDSVDNYADVGSAYVFARSGGSWSQQQKLLAAEGTGLDRFGNSVALSGNTVMVGASSDDISANADQGSAQAFVVGGNLAQSQKLLASDGLGDDRFGKALAVSGNTAVIGAWKNDLAGNLNQGAVYVFTRNGAAWSEVQTLYDQSTGAANDNFGYALALNGDTLLVGAPGANAGKGVVHVYKLNGLWIPQQKLTAADGAANDNFGFAVALSGDLALVGAAADTNGANNGQGSAYIFKRSGATWSQDEKLTASDGASGDFFGSAVALSGGLAAVGAYADNGNAADQGAVYVFEPFGPIWFEQQKLTASDSGLNHNFGWALALHGDTLLVGAPLNGKGAAYAFVFNGTNWSEQQKLSANDGVAGDSFGFSVAISGDLAVVGANADDTGGAGQDQGSAYLFARQASFWSQQQKLTANDSAAGDSFGGSVALDGNTVLVGAAGDDFGGQSEQGSAYAFNFAACPTITVTTATLPNGTVGTAYNQNITASGGGGPYQYSLSGGSLPPGLTLTQDGLLAGSPSNAGTYNFTITATTGSLCSGSHSYTLFIAPVCTPITINPATLPNGTVGTLYNQPLSAQDGTAPYGFNLAPGSTLPPGIGIVNSALSGVPAQAGAFNFTIQTIDANGCTGAKLYTLTIAPNCPAITVLPVNLPNGSFGAAYNQTFSGSGGQAPYTAGLTAGSLPPGLTLNLGNQITGVPTQLGIFNFTITLTDANGCTGQRNYSLTVSPACNPLTATPTTLPAGTQGVAYNQSLTGQGGVAPYTFTIEQATLPVPGLTLNANGTITGAPTTTGTFPFEVNITDVNGCAGTSQHMLTINPACGTLTINPPSLSNGTQGTAINVQLTSTGGNGSVGYSLSAGALPNGITLTPTGLLAGTPAQTGVFNFTITATDANGCTGQRNYELTINPACPTLTITPATLPNGATNTAYNQQLMQTGGNGAITWNVSAGQLPAGLSLSNSGLLSGTPTQAGNANFTVTATDANGCTGQKSYALTINVGCPTINVGPLPPSSATVGTAYNHAFNATGGSAPYTYSITAGALPVGLTLSAAGVISGTPTATGGNSFTVKATDANGCTGQTAFGLTTVCPTLTVTPATLPTVFLNVPYSQQLTGNGGAAPYAFSIMNGVLQQGLTLSAAGLLTGTVTNNAGTVAVLVQATDANGCTGTRNYQVQVTGCPAITLSPNGLPAGTVGTAYNQTITASGGAGPYTYTVSAGALPAGLTLSSAGALSGTPTASGQSFFTLKATDANGCFGTLAYALTINSNCPTITVNPATLPAGQMGVAYNQQLSASGGTAPYTYSVSLGNLPNGMTLSSAGALGGTPTVSGQFGFTVKATDANGCQGTRSYTLTANGCPSVTVNPVTLPNGSLGAAYNQQLAASGGAQPYVFSLQSGALPAGVTLSGTGALSGTPTASGQFNVTIKATDTNGCQGTRSYTLTINASCPAITVNPATLPGGFAGAAYNQQLSASGGTGPYSYSVTAGALPNGLTLSNGGVVSGTPTQAGSFNFTIKATDAQGCSGTRAYTVNFGGAGLMFYPLPFPLRLLDTRPGQLGCDAPGAPIPGGTSRTQLARRSCNGVTIPANALAVTGNVTTVQSGGGYLTLYPSNAGQPLVASTNFAPNEVVNNVFTVGLGNADGSFKIFATTDTDVVVDITGYYAPPVATGLYFHPLPQPLRLLDTRAGMQGCFTPGAPLIGNADTPQTGVVSCNGVIIPATAWALVGNATTVNPASGGYLTLYPADAQRPLAASSNFSTGQIMNAAFTVGLSPAGVFNIFTTTQTELVIDVLGYYSTEANDVNGAGLLFNPLSQPVRLLETRAGFTGCHTPNAPLLAGSTRNQQARGTCSGVTIANNALAIVGNATVVNAQSGYLTFWPSSAAQPLAATSNFNAGQILNRHFTTGLGADGVFKIFAAAQTDLVIDVAGYFAP